MTMNQNFQIFGEPIEKEKVNHFQDASAGEFGMPVTEEDHLNFQQTYDSQKQEGVGKASARYAAQPIIGALEGTGYGLVTGAWNLLGTGEALAALDELEESLPRLKKLFPDMGLPEKIDRKKYMEAVEAASYSVPSISNIASWVEKATGVPLEANTPLQRKLRLAGMSAKLKGGGIAPKLTAGVAAPTYSAILQKSGLPEPLADVLALAGSQVTPTPSIETVKTGSGLIRRRYENLKGPRKLSAGQYEGIVEAVESDVRKATDNIIKGKSELARTLEEDPTLPQKINESFDSVAKEAEKLPDVISTKTIKEGIEKRLQQKKGISPDEYERSLSAVSKDLLKDIPEDSKEVVSKWLEQYRKNNQSLSEIYESGQSSAYNRAKKEALLNYNKAIADAFEESLPGSNFTKLFKESNAAYTELMDVQRINGFINDVFGEKVNYNQLNKLFRNRTTQESFKRLLGKEGFNDFKSIFSDLSKTERNMKFLKKVNSPGYSDVVKGGVKWLISPTWAKLSAAKKGLQYIRNWSLKLPQYRVKWKSAFSDLKKGDFNAAAEKAKELQSIEKRAGKEAAKYYEKLFKDTKDVKYKDIADQITDVNTKFDASKVFGSTEFLSDVTEASGKSIAKNPIIRRKWDKLLKPEMYEKYYKTRPKVGEPKEIGTVGDFLKDEKYKESIKEVLDIPVFIRKSQKRNIGIHGTAFTRPIVSGRTETTRLGPGGMMITDSVPGKRLAKTERIEINSNLRPEEVRKVLYHEGLHGKQYTVSKTPRGESRGIVRHMEHDQFADYEQKLNEKYAFKFHRWVNKEINKYRTTSEKIKYAKHLLEIQAKKG